MPPRTSNFEPEPPAPNPPQPVPEPRDSAELRRQIEELEQRTAAQRGQAENIMKEIEDKELRQQLGLDIAFDVSKLITQGIVEKRGLKIMDGFWVDMHTLTKQEDIMSEQLVEQVYETLGGGIKLSKPYYEAKATAMLAMSVTRCNNKLFPRLPTEPGKEKTPEFQKSWAGKVELFNIILGFPASLVDALSFVYVNLEKADILLEGESQKKSSRP